MKTKLVLASSVLGLLLLTTPVLAEGMRPTGTPSFRKGLTELKLRSCEARQDSVKTRMNSLVKLVTNIEDKFDSIAKRVEDFYSNKVLPTGKTVPNYDKLVSDISAKKDVVATDLSNVQSKVSAFSCTGDDPKGILTEFRLGMQKVKSDLKDYRTAIKKLIVAVHAVAPKPTEKPEATESPKPSETQ